MSRAHTLAAIALCACSRTPEPSPIAASFGVVPDASASGDGATASETSASTLDADGTAHGVDTCSELRMEAAPDVDVSIGDYAANDVRARAVLLGTGRVLAVGDRWRHIRLFDPASNSWHPVSPPPFDVTNVGPPAIFTRLHDDVVLVGGGVSCKGKDCPGFEKIATYDAATDSWTASFAVFHGWGLSSAMDALLPDGRVLVVSALGEWILDVPTQTWTDVSTRLSGAHSFGAATGLADGRVLLTGGLDDDVDGVQSSPRAFVFVGVDLTLREVTPMHHARHGHVAVRLADGRALVAGGVRQQMHDTTGAPMTVTPLSSAEAYDPATDTWTEVASLPRARTAQTAVLLGCGGALVVGGMDEGWVWPTEIARHPIAEAYLYRPSLDRWSTHPLAFARTLSAVAPLPDGGALIVGGGDTQESVTSAEKATLR